MICSASNQLTSSQFKFQSLALNKSANDQLFICPFSNIKIVRPLIDLENFKNRMSDKKMVKLNNIRLHINKKKNDIDGDWVTIGVVTDKLPIRKTKTGADFSIWKLNDLFNLDKPVVLMLFGDAHETQWKLTKGSVIALLNCKILPNKDAKSDLTLSIEKGSKLMHLGSSKDIGNCKAPKNNGDICNTLINISNGNYCVYHIKADYAKISSMRPELQATMTGFGVQNKFSSGRNIQPLSSLRKETNSDNVQANQTDQEKKDGLLNKYNSRKAQEAEVLSKQLNNEMLCITGRNLLQYQKVVTSNQPKESSYDKARKLLLQADEKHSKPILCKGLKPGDVFDFNKKISGTELAKQRAIQMVKNRRIERQDPNRVFASSAKRNKFELSNILNKVETNLNESEETLNLIDKSKERITMNSETIERRKRRAQEEVECKKRKKEAIDAIMNRKSSHEFEIIEKEIEAENKYFNLMEKKEQIENNMSSIFQIECNVVICKLCQYTASHQSDLCKDKNHLIINKKMIKRFFKCKECKQRTHTYSQIYPVKRCKCGSDLFEKCSMYNVKEAPKLDNEKLLIRGEEIKFLNSLK